MSSINGKINYCLFIGDTFKQPIQIKQDESVVDVSTYSFKMQIRRCKDSNTIIHELTTPADIDTSDGVNGIIVLNISSATSLTFDEQNAVYDLFWIDNAGDVKTIMQGNFQILERITKN
jgi:hypothetical protein